MKRILLIIVLCALSSILLFAQIEIMDNFELGKYRVGFEHKVITDYSRSYGDSSRPVQLFVWYPSEEKSETPFNYTEYLLFNSSGKKSDKSIIDSLLRKEIVSRDISGNEEVVRSNYRKLKTIAHENVPIASGSFPLILFAPGGNTSGYLHSALCEFLASHGNIVVSIPSLGISDSERWPFDQIGINLQLGDMAIAINHMAHSIENINIGKICLASWSVGGVSQGILSMKNSSIDMFISIDSGLGRAYGVEMIKESPYFDYNKVHVPYLHMTGKQPEQYIVERSTEFHDSIPSQHKYLLEIEPFAHQHFTTQLGLIPALIAENKDNVVEDGFINMSKLTLDFINAFLKNEEGALNKWKSLYNSN